MLTEKFEFIIAVMLRAFNQMWSVATGHNALLYSPAMLTNSDMRDWSIAGNDPLMMTVDKVLQSRKKQV